MLQIFAIVRSKDTRFFISLHYLINAFLCIADTGCTDKDGYQEPGNT